MNKERYLQVLAATLQEAEAIHETADDMDRAQYLSGYIAGLSEAVQLMKSGEYLEAQEKMYGINEYEPEGEEFYKGIRISWDASGCTVDETFYNGFVFDNPVNAKKSIDFHNLNSAEFDKMVGEIWDILKTYARDTFGRLRSLESFVSGEMGGKIPGAGIKPGDCSKELYNAIHLVHSAPEWKQWADGMVRELCDAIANERKYFAVDDKREEKKER